MPPGLAAQMACWRGVCKRCASTHGNKLEVPFRGMGQEFLQPWNFEDSNSKSASFCHPHFLEVYSCYSCKARRKKNRTFPQRTLGCFWAKHCGQPPGPLRPGKIRGNWCLLHGLPGQLQENAESHGRTSETTGGPATASFLFLFWCFFGGWDEDG